MRLYHFVNHQYGLENIRQRRLKIATLNDLNDPFELRGVSLPDKRDRRAVDLFRQEFSTRWGMLCFSKSWRNPVQWSHYADRHHGICLGFDVSDDVVTSVTYKQKVHDQNIVELLKGGDLDLAHSAMLELLRTKYSSWRYEREARVFTTLNEPDPNTALYFEPFNDQLMLREVIVGHRSILGRAELRSALGDLANDVVAKKARLAFRSFNVVHQRSRALWG